MSEAEYRQKAEKIVKAKKAFRINALLFAINMPIIIIVNLWTSPEYLWFLWSLMGWGLTVVILYLVAYVLPKYNLNESDEVEKEMEKMRLHKHKVSQNKNLDEHLDLRELRKDYNERDFV